MLRKSTAKKTQSYLNKIDKRTKKVAVAFVSNKRGFNHKAALKVLARNEKELRRIYAAVKSLLASKSAIVRASKANANSNIENILSTIAGLATRIDIISSAIKAEDADDIDLDDIGTDDDDDDLGDDDTDIDLGDDGDDDSGFYSNEDTDDDDDDIDLGDDDDIDLGDDDDDTDIDLGDDGDLPGVSFNKRLVKKKIAKKKVSSRNKAKSTKLDGLFNFIK